MNGSNRRGFLKIAGAGAAAVGAASLVPTPVSNAGSTPKVAPAVAPEATLPAEASGSMVAYIHDVTSGEVSVMVEGKEVTIVDHQLVAKLATAMHSHQQV